MTRNVEISDVATTTTTTTAMEIEADNSSSSSSSSNHLLNDNEEADDEDDYNKNNNDKYEKKTVIPTATTTDEASSASTKAATAACVVFSPELLQMYYARLFPFDMLYTWLSYGSNNNNNNNSFAKREFSFTVEPVPGEEIYMRHQSFGNGQALRTAMLKKRPIKMDLGAMYQQPPVDKNAIQKNKNLPVERELIFDVDMDDYDPVRHCGCQGAGQICYKCWNFMKMAVCVMDEGLRQDFGFEHVAWFYSGRRGVHGWVCDETARTLTDEGRSAVANYFSVFLGNEKNKDAAKMQSPIHPMLQRAYEILEPMFVQYILPATGHSILATPAACQAFLQELPETAAPVRDKLMPKWTKDDQQCAKSTPEEKWNEIQQHMTSFVRATAKKGADKSNKTMTSAERSRLENWHVEVVFRYTYPRLDINVSTHRNHLLKSPFCVHPKTGRVCVPISNVQEFDPFVVPTLPQLMQELDQYDAAATAAADDKNKGNVKKENGNDDADDDDDNDDENEANDENRQQVPHWKKTSLKKYFETFQKEFLDPMIRKQRHQERDEAEQKAAILGDF